MLFPFISTSSRIIVNGTKQLLVAIRYLFLTKKLAEEILIGFEEELWMLTFYLVLHYVIRSYVYRLTMKKRGQRAGGTNFWPILLMVVHGFWRRGFSFCDMQRFLTFMWLFSVTLLPRDQFNLQCNYRNTRGTKVYQQAQLTCVCFSVSFIALMKLVNIARFRREKSFV